VVGGASAPELQPTATRAVPKSTARIATPLENARAKQKGSNSGFASISSHYLSAKKRFRAEPARRRPRDGGGSNRRTQFGRRVPAELTPLDRVNECERDRHASSPSASPC